MSSEDKPFEDTSEYDQDPDRYLKLAKHFVLADLIYRQDRDIILSVDQLYIVWFAKTLQNWKAILSTSIAGDGVLFEVTFNGDKNEAYVDTYLKHSNTAISYEAMQQLVKDI